MAEELQHRLEALDRLWWLTDAPLFIDDELVRRFFDAIVRPEYERGPETFRSSEKRYKEIKGQLEGKAQGDLKLPEWLKPIDVSAQLSTKLRADKRREDEQERSIQLIPIWTAERQLEELVRYYFLNYPDKLVLVADDGEGLRGSTLTVETLNTDLSELAADAPRPLVFLDLPSKTEVIPIAAEFADGHTCLIYEKLALALTTEKGGPIREYPEPSELSSKNYKEQRRKYWNSFKEHFKSNKAMIAIENASKGHGRIEWIDFRVPYQRDTIHLHAVPAGNVSGGVFGYNFVRRGDRHGVRIVGTLKAGPDINILAIYEK